jgi:hypothetical protein
VVLGWIILHVTWNRRATPIDERERPNREGRRDSLQFYGSHRLSDGLQSFWGNRLWA